MRRISFWAKSNPFKARLSIVFGFILLNLLAIFTGTLITDLYITLPDWIPVITALASIIAVIFYPAKKEKGTIIPPSVFYIRQKTCEIILITCTFVMICFFGNHLDEYLDVSSPSYAANPVSPNNSTTAPRYKTISDFKASLMDKDGNPLKWKARKKLLKEQIREVRRAKDKTPGEKVLLIILSVLAACALIVGVAALSCSIGCAGAEVLAAVVFIVGSALVIWLLIALIRGINRKRPN